MRRADMRLSALRYSRLIQQGRAGVTAAMCLDVRRGRVAAEGLDHDVGRRRCAHSLQRRISTPAAPRARSAPAVSHRRSQDAPSRRAWRGRRPVASTRRRRRGCRSRGRRGPSARAALSRCAADNRRLNGRESGLPNPARERLARRSGRAAVAARRVPVLRCRRPGAVRRQGAQPEEARLELLPQGPRRHAHRRDGGPHRAAANDGGAQRGRGAAAREQPHQDAGAALQHPVSRRQELPVPEAGVAPSSRAWRTTAAASIGGTSTSGRTPAPGP